MNVVQYIVNPAFEGLHNFNNNNYIYCSSGVGTSGPPIRTMSKAKIGILNLTGNNQNKNRILFFNIYKYYF